MKDFYSKNTKKSTDNKDLMDLSGQSYFINLKLCKFAKGGVTDLSAKFLFKQKTCKTDCR